MLQDALEIVCTINTVMVKFAPVSHVRLDGDSCSGCGLSGCGLYVLGGRGAPAHTCGTWLGEGWAGMRHLWVFIRRLEWRRS